MFFEWIKWKIIAEHFRMYNNDSNWDFPQCAHVTSTRLCSLRKNWAQSWTVLHGGILTFYKDPKSAPGGNVVRSLKLFRTGLKEIPLSLLNHIGFILSVLFRRRLIRSSQSSPWS